jgi:hypothetical protein
MTRQPDLKNKLNRLVYIPSDVAENKLSMDVKALCIQDGITIRDFLSEAIALAFKVHNWPPGNPQLTLSNYQVKPLDMGHCGYSGCKNKACGSGLYLPKQQEFKLCQIHFDGAKNTSKVWGSLKSWKGDLP